MGYRASWLVFAYWAIAGACQGGEVPGFRIGLLPDDSAQALLSRFEPMHPSGDDLACSVKVVIPSLERSHSYKDLVDAFAEGKIDIALFGGVTFLEASGRTPTAPLVMRRQDTRFRSYFITRTGSKAKSLEGLKGMRFAFGASDSTSGYLMPLYYLKEMGIDPDKDFQGPPQFSGTHSRTLEWVLSGQVDAGVMNGQIFDSLLRGKKLDLKKIDIAWVSPGYPDYIWAARENVPPEVRKQVQQAFLTLRPSDMQDAPVHDGLGADFYVVPDLQAFERLKDIVDHLSRKASSGQARSVPVARREPSEPQNRNANKMPPNFALRGLKYRILAVALSGIIVFGALWLGVILYFTAEESRAIEVRATVRDARIAALQMGNEARDFMSWDVRSPAFHKMRRIGNLDQHEAALQELDREIEHLAWLEYAGMAKSRSVEDLIELSKKYQRTFRRLVAAFRERGHEIWGLEGKWEQTILKLEVVLSQFQEPILQKDLLELRRAQQDFLLVGQEQHVLEVRWAIKPLRDNVMKFADGGDLLERVNGCEGAFDHLLAVQKEIGLKEGEGLRGELSATAAAMDPLIDELLREAIARDDRAARTFNLMLLAGGLVSLLFGAAFAIAFARRLTRPIEELTRVMGRSGGFGGFDATG